MYICKYFKIIKLHFYFNSQLFLIILKRFEFNDIKLALARIDVADDLPQLPESHILLLRMLFGQRIERHRRGRGHGNGAKIAVIFIAPNAQHIAGLKVRLRCIANGDGFAPGEDVVLKTLKKGNVIGLRDIIPSWSL